MRRVLAGVMAVLLVTGMIPVDVSADQKEKLTEQNADYISASSDMELAEDGNYPTILFETCSIYGAENSWKSTLESRLYSAMDQIETTVDLSDLYRIYGETAVNGLQECFEEVKNENPDLFYVESYSYNYSNSNEKEWVVTLRYRKEYCSDANQSIPDKEKIETARTEYQDGMNRALASVDDAMSDVEKVLAIHDWLVRECDYDEHAYLNEDVSEDSYSDAGVFIEGKAVCNGYALAFSVLMQQLGIPSYFVGSYRMNHAWNLVYVNGAWYHVDTTWDDPVMDKTTVWGFENNDYADEGYVSHKYFLLSDEEIKKENHYGWSSDLPKADKSGTFEGTCFYKRDVSFNYYNKFWYYANGSSIVCGTINGAMTVERTVKGQIMYMFAHEGVLYYLLAGNPNLVYSIPIEKLSDSSFEPEVNQNAKKLCDAGETISELSIKKDKLVVVSYKDGTYNRNTFSFETLNLNGICYNIKDTGIDMGAAYNSSNENVKFRWLSYNLSTGEWSQISDWYNGNWVTWKPKMGDYWVQVQAKTDSGLTESQTICFHAEKDYSKQYLSLDGFCYMDQGDRIDIGTAYKSSDSEVKFRWLSYNLDTGEWEQISDWYAGNWTSWKPNTGNYWLQVQAKTIDGIEKTDTMCFRVDKDYGSTLKLNGICYIYQDTGIDIGVSYDCSEQNVEFRWLSYNLDTGEWEQISDWYAGNWATWVPKAGNYWVQVQAKTGESNETYTICFCVNKNYK